jgi:excisionase family DNA binding protein
MPEIMTLQQVAEYLKFSKDKVYQMANAGKIPAIKIGKQWRFDKNDLNKWIEEHKRNYTVKD